MRIILSKNDKKKVTGFNIVNIKLAPSHAKERKSGHKRKHASISKAGRLVDVEFSYKSELTGPGRGFLSFAESEILLLASLCRRDRSDEKFLEAIISAAEGTTKPKRTGGRLTRVINSMEDEAGEDEYDDGDHPDDWMIAGPSE